jgi:hypothetical protein
MPENNPNNPDINNNQPETGNYNPQPNFGASMPEIHQPESGFASISWPVWVAVIIGCMLIAAGVGAGAYAMFQNRDKPGSSSNTNTADTKKESKASTYEECAAITSSTITKNPNQCKTAEGETFTELVKVPTKITDAKPEVPVVTKKAVKSIANGSKGTGVNVRINPCETITGNLQKWDSTGELLGGPIEKECLGGKYTWYQVSWTDGSKGWSISDNLQITDGSSSTVKTGISGGLIYPSEFVPNQRLCAKNLVSAAEKCIDTSGQTYFIAVDPGKYNVYVKGVLDNDGKLQPWGNLVHYNKYVKDCIMEGYPGKDCQGGSIPASFHTTILEVVVEAGKTTPNINPWDWYAPS